MKHVHLQVCRSKVTAGLSVSSELSELLQSTQTALFDYFTESQANPANPGAGLSWSRHRNTRKV